MAKKKLSDAEGLGDTIAYLTELLKIDRAVKSVTQAMGIEDCGCTRRQEELNKLFPYKKKENDEK